MFDILLKLVKLLFGGLNVQRCLYTFLNFHIPFLDAIQQVPVYAKFLKDLVTMKRKTSVPKKAFLTEQISSIIQNKYLVKCKDPGSPTISCKIRIVSLSELC